MTAPRFSLLFSVLLAAAPGATLGWRDTTVTTQDRQKPQVRGQSAVLVAPEDPAHPDQAKVELMVLRLPATTASPLAPIVFLHGGPGASGIEHLQSADFRALFAALQEEADVVLFDQRGCGQSKPSLVPVRPPLSPNLLVTRDSFLAYLKAGSTPVRDAMRQAGHDPRCYTVLQSAADIEALRQALGAEKLNLLAHSYGTQLAQAYARLYPQRIERMVLVGPRGMDTNRKLPAQADAFLRQIADLARNDATVGAKFPDLLATLRRVLTKLDAKSVAVTMETDAKQKVTLNVGGYTLRFIIAKFYLNDPDNIKYLPKLLDELDTGRRPWSLVYNLGQILRSPVSCVWFTTDGASGVSAARAESICHQAVSAMLGDAMNFPFPDINEVWAMADLGDEFRAPVQSAVPTLFVAGTLDGLTPVEQAHEVAQGFSESRLLTVKNGGHNSQIRAPGCAAAVAGFFAGRPPPAELTLPPLQFVPLVTTQK